MPRRCKTGWLRTTALVVAAAALLGGGCAPLLIGGALAAGGAAGYAYYAGQYNRDFDAGALEVRHAARAVLTDMGVPVVEEHSDTNGGWFVSNTPGGERLSVTFTDFPDQNSPSGFVTRVGVRVAAFGDPTFSRDFLDRVGHHLYPNGPPPPRTPATPTGRLTPQPVRPAETSPPPLADPRAPLAAPASDPNWQKPPTK
jgi:hypothetical protein